MALHILKATTRRLSVKYAEIVLSELLANFVFEPSTTPVVWNFSGITFASTSYESRKPELWLTVRRL